MKVVNDSEGQWWKCSVSSVRRAVILVAKDRAGAGIVLYLAQDSPGLAIVERFADWGPWPHAGPVCIKQFMEMPHID